MKQPETALTDRERFYWELQEKVRAKVPEFDIDAVRVAFAVLFTFSEMETRITRRLQEKGMTLPGFNCLVLLHHGNMDGHSLTELSNFLVSSRANVTGVIDSLAKRGFVTREDHPKDRRVIMAKITPEGRAWLQGYFPGHARMMAGFSAALNKTEKQQAVSLLGKMRAGILKTLPAIALSLLSGFSSAAEAPKLSLTLNQVIDAAFKQAPELRAAQHRAGAAEDRAKAERGRLYPEIAIEGSGRRVSEIPTLTLPTGQSLSLTDNESFSIGPAAKLSLFKGGADIATWKSAKAQGRAQRAQEQLIGRQWKLAAQLAYFQAQLAAEQVQLLVESYKVEDQQYRDIQSQYKAGSAARIDLLSAHQQTLTRRKQLLEARADLATALRELTRVTGLGESMDPSLPMDARTTLPLPRDVETPTLILDVAAAAETVKELDRLEKAIFDPAQPGIQFFAELAEASRQAAKSAQGTRWPELTLLAKTSWDYPNGPIREMIHQNTVGANLNFPIFTGGRLASNARAKKKEALASEEDRIREARDLLTAWQKARDLIGTLRAQQKLNDTTITEAQELARLQYQSYRAGRARYLDVEDANLKVLQARTDAARTDVRLLVQLANLESLSKLKE